MLVTRRALLMAAAAGTAAAPIDTHIHLFDPKRFPYHPSATYAPPAETLDGYASFAAGVLSHAVIVHPEPYQDDHRYLEYCLQNEPRKGFFKGTCLFDGTDPATAERMAALTAKWPGRIVALRVHAANATIQPGGPIRDRDLGHPQMAKTWAAAAKLGLAIQMHMTPRWAPAVERLVTQTPGVRVVIDHLCRYAQGTPEEYESVLRLGRHPGVFMKFSGLNYSSKQPPPYRDLAPLCRKIHAAFGPSRIIWGGLGMQAADFEKQKLAFETLWAFLPEADRQKIRHGNAASLYRFG